MLVSEVRREGHNRDDPPFRGTITRGPFKQARMLASSLEYGGRLAYKVRKVKSEFLPTPNHM
jgi:hypothetical protein